MALLKYAHLPYNDLMGGTSASVEIAAFGFYTCRILVTCHISGTSLGDCKLLIGSSLLDLLIVGM